MSTEEEERSFVEYMRKMPDFDCYVFPQSWYKKYNIPYVPPMDVREYMKSNYAMKMAVAPKDLPPIILTEPQRDAQGHIKLIVPPPVEIVPMEIINGYNQPDLADFTGTLPGGRD